MLGDSRHGARLPDRRDREHEVERADRRWFLAVAGIFGGSLLLIFGARRLYHLTGPHPEVTVFLRRIRRIARWLIPQHRRWRKI